MHCESPDQETQALPKNVGKEWGPGEDMARAGIEPVTHPDGTVEAEDGTIEVNLSFEHASFQH